MKSIFRRIISLFAAVLIMFGMLLTALPADTAAYAGDNEIAKFIGENQNNPGLPKGYKETEEVLDLSQVIDAAVLKENNIYGLCLYPYVLYNYKVHDFFEDFVRVNGSKDFHLDDYERWGTNTKFIVKDPYNGDVRICITEDGYEDGYEYQGFLLTYQSSYIDGEIITQDFFRRISVDLDTYGVPIKVSDFVFKDGLLSLTYKGSYEYIYVQWGEKEGFVDEDNYEAYNAFREANHIDIRGTEEVNCSTDSCEYFVSDSGKLILKINNGEFATYFRVDGVRVNENATPIPTETEDPIIQEVITPGDDTPGEDKGTRIRREIVEGDDDPGILGMLPIAVGGAVAAGGIAALIAGSKKGGDGDDEKKKSGYRMYVNKEFGNVLKRGEEPKIVYARITELTPSGGEATRDDLTAKIEPFSADGVLDVASGGMRGNYMAAIVQVPDVCTEAEGCVSFRYKGKGGTFIRHVVFRLTAAEIIFPQENLGLPANKLKYVLESNEPKAEGKDNRLGNGLYRMPFGVKDMPKGFSVSAKIERCGATDVNGHYINSSKMEKPIPYTVEVIPDPEYKEHDIYLAVIKEVEEYELGAGISEGFALKVTAEYGTAGAEGYEKAVGTLPIYRIHMGLAVTIENSSIPCYQKLKPGRENKERDKITGEDLEIVSSEGSLLLFLCNEKDLSIVRVPVCPVCDKEGKPIPLKVTPTKVENDRYCKRGDADKNHQDMVDKLGICAFSTGRLLNNKAHVIKLCATSGIMDPPTRLLADVEFTVEYNGKIYSAVKSLLLRSQDFRVPKNSDDEREFLERDKHVSEQLLRISTKIDNEYAGRLYSLADMIDRMVDGYDYRFGYDESQLKNVMEMWVGFIEGTFAGARGTPVGITFSDELKATYAFMQGLRDNTTFLGRIAMGVMTMGVSEYIFSIMTVSEKMEQAVYSCKGDKDFGFWDGVKIGVEEFGQQIIMDIIMGGLLETVGSIKIDADLSIADKLAQIGTKYRTAMDSADTWMKNNSKLYKFADDAFQHTKNFFNSSAAAGKSAIEKNIKDTDEAMARCEELMKKNRKSLNAEDLAELKKHEAKVERGMEKVRNLQEAQMELRKASDPKSLKAAETKYRNAANEVWTDKYALRQLQRNRHSSADELRAQFNRYRETLLDEVQLEALNDIALETGIPRENLYIKNVSSNAGDKIKTGKKVPSDRDITFKQKVLSDRSLDVTIDQSLGERAVARRLYKKMNGKEPDTIKEALDFMKAKDVTYVNPRGDSGSLVSGPNLEGYADLEAMTGIKADGTIDKSLLANDLHNPYIDRASIKHKAMEWFGRGDEVEGIYQLHKQVQNIIIERGLRRTGKNPLTPEAKILHEMAEKVVDGYISPAEFKATLRIDYNMSLEGFVDYMCKFLT
jgi:hypothetical protein